MTRPHLVIASHALVKAEADADRATAAEAGGVLIGFRIDNAVHVEEILTVNDNQATRTKFVLRSRTRDATIEDFRASLPSDSPLGYVGTWHSHLADAGPSTTDRLTFQKEVFSASDAVAMLILAKTTGGWRHRCLVGEQRFIVKTADVVVC